MTLALRDAAFRRLAALYALNSLVGWVGDIAQLVIVYEATGSAVATAAMLLCKQLLPALFVPAFARRVEGRDERLVIGVAAAIQALMLAALAASGYGPLLFPIVVIAGAANVLTRSVIRGAVSRGATGLDLRTANAALNVIMGFTGPAAPLVGALLIAIGGPVGGLLCAAAIFACIVPACAAIPAFRSSELSGDEDDSKAADPDAERGASALLPVAWLVALAGVITCTSSIDEPSLLAFSQDVLGSGVAGYSAIFAVQAVGATVGSVLFGRLMHWRMLSIYALATVVAGLGFLGMAVSPNIVIACVAGFFVGVGTGMDWVAVVTAVQEAAPRGRETLYAARVEAAGTAGPAFGFLVGGAIAELGSPRWALVAPGVLSLAIVFGGAIVLQARFLRRRSSRQVIFSPSIPGGSV